MLPKKDRLMITNRVYRHKIEVWKLEGEVENELEEIVQEPIKVYDLWGQVIPVRGKEYVTLETLTPEMQYKITTRYRSDIDPSMIIKWQGRELNIKAIVDISGREEEMEIMCIEKVKTSG